MKLSEIVSYKIIRLDEARELGVLLSLIVDKKGRYAKQFATADVEEEDGYLPVRYVRFGKDAAFTLNRELGYEKVGVTLPLRFPVYDTDGNLRGVLTDVEWSGSLVSRYYLDNGGLFLPQDVFLIGEKMVLLKGKVKCRAAKKKPEQKVELAQAFTSPKVEKEEEEVAAERAEEAPQAEPARTYENSEVPEKLVYGYGFLLGRVTRKAVFAEGEEVIAAGEIIDRATVEKAWKKGKLVELTVSSAAAKK